MSINTRNTIAGVVLIALFITLFAVFNYFSTKEKNIVADKNGKYIMLNESLIWQKKGSKFVQLNKVPEHFFDYKFTLYHGTDKINNVIVDSYDSFYSYYDKDYKELNYNDFRAISRNYDLKFPDYTIEMNENNNEYLNELLDKYGYKQTQNYYSYYVTLDFDKDGTEETLYASTNYEFNSTNKDCHSFFYMVKNDKIVDVIENKDLPYNFVSVLDIDKDNKYEVVMSYAVKNNPTLDACYKLYKYKKDKWIIIKDCEG